jgi:hypothetical protein
MQKHAKTMMNDDPADLFLTMRPRPTALTFI